VLVDLSDGGFAAYVAASHPRSWKDLCLMHSVKLDQLNKPLPADLLVEVQRFEALEHNTYIRHGLRAGDIIPMPDAEGEQLVKHAPFKPTFDLASPPSKAVSKRSLSDVV